jgi:menaquinol-cytochrome c reductase cytochrome b subunit
MSDTTSAPRGTEQNLAPSVPTVPVAPRRPGMWEALGDQFALRPLIKEYLIPVEANNLWYALGGVLAISLVLEVVTGMLLSLVYVPDASRAFDITKGLMQDAPWALVLNLHYWNAFLIFALVMVHMMRVFLSGGYRRGKQGLWGVGIGLAALTFVVSVTGESLHWDEVGFGVPWNAGEVANAFGLGGLLNYDPESLKDLATATAKLGQIYAVHIAIVPILLVLLIGVHYYLIKVKGISAPFWVRGSGRTAPFSTHIRAWLIYSAVLLGLVLLIAVFVPRDAGTAPQLLPSSPLFNTTDDPGGLGFKPSFPISWTRGMNILVASWGVDPDIWGTIVGMALMLLALILVPFVDRGDHEPGTWRDALNWRKRGWAFAAIALFWIILIVGFLEGAFTGAG